VRRTARRLWRDRRGAALVEFAIIAPVMLLLLLGSVETAHLVESHRRVAHTASAVADLVAQERQVDGAKLADIFLAGDLIIAPLPPERLGVRVSSFVADSQGKVSREWFAEGRPYAGGAPASLPSGYTLPRGQGVIVADVSYRYRPVLRWVLLGEFTLQKRMLLRPRIADKVVRVTG
jgi:Flp pilus assembly protein TadG